MVTNASIVPKNKLYAGLKHVDKLKPEPSLKTGPTRKPGPTHKQL